MLGFGRASCGREVPERSVSTIDLIDPCDCDAVVFGELERIDAIICFQSEFT